MKRRHSLAFSGAVLLLAAAVAAAPGAAPQDPYEVCEDKESVLASAPHSAAPTFTLGSPFFQSATGWLPPVSGLASLLPEFRLTLDASMPSAGALAPSSSAPLADPLGELERRVKGVEVLVPQTKGLWLGWAWPEYEGEPPRATLSIRNSF